MDGCQEGNRNDGLISENSGRRTELRNPGGWETSHPENHISQIQIRIRKTRPFCGQPRLPRLRQQVSHPAHSGREPGCRVAVHD